jgi:hypothetical protein
MDTPEKRNDSQNDLDQTSDPLENIDLTEDIDEELSEVDDTAILNELLHDLSPDLVDDQDQQDTPLAEEPKPVPTEETVAPITEEPPTTDASASEQEGSWLFDDDTSGDDTPDVDPPDDAPEEAAPVTSSVDKPADTSGSWLFDGDEAESEDAEDATVEESVEAPIAEETPSSSSGSWLFDDDDESEPATEEKPEAEEESVVETEQIPDIEEESVVEAIEEPVVEEKSSGDSGSWLFDDTLDESAVEEVVEPETTEETAESESEESSDSGMFGEAALGDVLSALDEEPAAEEEAVTETETPAEVDTIEDVESGDDDVDVPLAVAEEATEATPQAVANGETSADVVADLTKAVADHFVTRLELAAHGSQDAVLLPDVEEAEEEASDPAPRDTSEDEGALTADIEDDFLVAVDDDSDSVEEPSIADVGDTLATDFLQEQTSDDDQAETLTMDDLISSAVLSTEEPEPLVQVEIDESLLPEEEQVAAETSAEDDAPSVVATTPQTDGDDELDQLIREMKDRQKRRRMIGSIIAAVVVLFIGYLIMGPSEDEEQMPVNDIVELQQQDDVAEEESQPTVSDDAPVAEEPAVQAVSATQTPPPIAQQTRPSPTATPTPSRITPRTPTASVPAARSTAARVTSTPTGPYTVHASSYGSAESADLGRETWNRRGYDLTVVWTWVSREGQQWHRLGVGRYTSREQCQQAKDELISQNFLTVDDWAPITRIPEGAR